MIDFTGKLLLTDEDTHEIKFGKSFIIGLIQSMGEKKAVHLLEHFLFDSVEDAIEWIGARTLEFIAVYKSNLDHDAKMKYITRRLKLRRRSIRNRRKR